jgi:t-SNARE complex subunit (syntaxin)
LEELLTINEMVRSNPDKLSPEEKRESIPRKMKKDLRETHEIAEISENQKKLRDKNWSDLNLLKTQNEDTRKKIHRKIQKYSKSDSERHRKNYPNLQCEIPLIRRS